MNTIERNELLTALYQVTSKSDLLKQFDSKLSSAKGSTNQRYTFLLEQVLFYSHAVIFGHGIQTAHNYRQSFMTTAKKSKLLKLSDEDIETAFSFLNRTEKKSIVKTIELQNSPKNESLEINSSCIAKDEIKRLKAQLDNKTYELAKGQKEEDKIIFIKVALVALSVGARLKEIMEDLSISTKKGVVLFDDGIKQEEGVILELDTKTVQSYLKAIRSHYSDRIAKGTDISTSIRKSILGMNIKFIGNNTSRKIKHPKTKKVIRVVEYKDIATSLNHLNALYRECLTSSTPK